MASPSTCENDVDEDGEERTVDVDDDVEDEDKRGEIVTLTEGVHSFPLIVMVKLYTPALVIRGTS